MLRGRVALSDPKIADLIEKNFVTAVGEHSILLRGSRREWWLTEVRRVMPNYAGASTQGHYLLTADGSAFAYDNHPPRLQEYLTRGLARFRQMPRREAGASETEVRQAAPIEPPAGASVLRIFTRTRDADGDMHPETWLARDHMWVLGDEMQAMARISEMGRDVPAPASMVNRMVVYHMTDGTRGQVWPWQTGSVRRADMSIRLLQTSGTAKTFAWRGEYAKRDSHPPQWNERGDEGRLEGEFTIDTNKLKFTRFRVYGEGQAWSDATYSRVSPPPRGRYTLVRAIVEANDDLARQTTPESYNGQAYLRPEMPRR